MSESQTELNNNRKKQLDLFRKLMPDFAEQLGVQMHEVYKDGAIDRKTKHLMAMAIALGVGCHNCVLAQAEAALALGATKEDFLEAISIVISMRGTTGIAESLRVVQFLDEQGKL
ncbi:MAG: carboxymuconolactone decarboxylase family protein [Deltaproteobacteria bacterium]|nr:carboxymuconolactone decarboxylase family protein [Deltaproteobacteria bacterium]